MKDLVLVAATLLLISCSTSEDPVPIAPFDEALLTNDAGWQLISEIKDDGVNKTDLSLAYAGCLRDDQFQFKVDYTYVVTEGDSKCREDDPVIKLTGTWKWVSGVITLTPTSSVSQPFTFTMASTSFSI